MGTYIWLNVPFMLFFFGCWAGIPLWLTLTRWKAELRAKNADMAATAAREPVAARPAPAMAAALATVGVGYAGAGQDRER